MANLKQVLDDVKHIGPIADSMAEWDGTIADALELTYPEREEISDAHHGKLGKQKRMALMKWKQKKGNQATFENLIKAFESISYMQYADNVRRICKETSTPLESSKSDEPPKLAKAFKLLMPISQHWKNIGVLLELDNGKLSGIEVQFRGVPDDCLREMIGLWLKQVNPRPTRSALVEAVKAYDPSLAERIADS